MIVDGIPSFEELLEGVSMVSSFALLRSQVSPDSSLFTSAFSESSTVYFVNVCSDGEPWSGLPVGSSDLRDRIRPGS